MCALSARIRERTHEKYLSSLRRDESGTGIGEPASPSLSIAVFLMGAMSHRAPDHTHQQRPGRIGAVTACPGTLAREV